MDLQVIVVSHGGVLIDLYRLATDTPWGVQAELKKLNTSISILEHSVEEHSASELAVTQSGLVQGGKPTGVWSLVAWGITCHLHGLVDKISDDKVLGADVAVEEATSAATEKSEM